MRRIFAWLVLVVACGTHQAPPPTGVRTIAVAPPVNRTGSELVVAGDWYLERLLGARRATAADVVGAEAARLLGEHGFDVVPPGTPGAAELRVTLRRFDADVPHDEYVVADVDAVLTADDRTLWSTSRRSWIVPTRGAPSVAESWAMAARAVAQSLVDGWRPAPEHVP